MENLQKDNSPTILKSFGIDDDLNKSRTAGAKDKKKRIKIGYGDKQLLTKHIKHLKSIGVEAKIENDPHNYSFKKNRSLTVGAEHEKKVKHHIKQWHRENPNEPTPYIGDNRGFGFEEYKN